MQQGSPCRLLVDCGVRMSMQQGSPCRLLVDCWLRCDSTCLVRVRAFRLCSCSRCGPIAVCSDRSLIVSCLLPSAASQTPARSRAAGAATAFPHFPALSTTLFGVFMVLETSLRSPRVHLFYNPTLAGWRSPSRMTRQTSNSFKDSLEHPLEDAAWRLPHATRARQITNNKRIRSSARPP